MLELHVHGGLEHSLPMTNKETSQFFHLSKTQGVVFHKFGHVNNFHKPTNAASTCIYMVAGVQFNNYD